MKNRYNHGAYTGRAVYLGRASIQGYALYDLGYYPGNLHDSGTGWVFGELNEVSSEGFERFCRLEGTDIPVSVRERRSKTCSQS